MMSLQTINDTIQKAAAVCQKFENIFVSVSGGSDSDIMVDLLLKACPKEKLTFAFFDTGIEYAATKNHLDYLEQHYGIKIDRQKSLVPVPLGCKQHGLPFISKFVSQMIERLQKHKFDFEKDGLKSFDELKAIYPNCIGALTWWTNSYPAQKGKKSLFNINSNFGLKEFMITNPPTFNISAKCCIGAKEKTSIEYEQQHNFDCKCLGLRRAEGGIRSSQFKSCFEFDSSTTMQKFRPIWWFDDATKALYAAFFSVKFSECYTLYGFKRTGCAGCPYNSKFEEDLNTLEHFEPKLYNAVYSIFGESYDYTRRYRQFKHALKEIQKHDTTTKTIKYFQTFF